MVQWKSTLPEDLICENPCYIYMNKQDFFSGKSIFIENDLDLIAQKDLIEKGYLYNYSTFVPTEKNKKNYLRATIKGIITQSSFIQIIQSKNIFVSDQLKVIEENVVEEKILAKEFYFIQTSTNLAALFFPNSYLFVIGKNFNLTPVLPENLKKGDRIAVIKKLNENNVELISPRKARFLMLLLGDGHITKSSQRIFLTSGDEEVLQNFSRLSKNIFNKEAKISKPYANIYSVKIARELIKMGFSKNQKLETGIPNEILKSNRIVLLSALGGLIDTDGNIFAKQDQIRVDTASYKVALDIFCLFLKLGLFPSINLSNSTFGVRCQITKEFADLLNPFVVSKRKKMQLSKITNPKKSQEQDLLAVKGNDLKGLRKTNCDTLYSLGEKLGISFKAVHEIETEKRKPKIIILKKIAEIYSDKNLLNVSTSSIATVKVKNIEKINFGTFKEIMVPKTDKIFTSNFILTKKVKTNG